MSSSLTEKFVSPLRRCWAKHGGRGPDGMFHGLAVPGRLIAVLLSIWLANCETAPAQEIVSFPSLDSGMTNGAPATRLRAVLLRPTGRGPFPAVVALHGCTGLFDKQGKLVAREGVWGEELTKQGYVVL